MRRRARAPEAGFTLIEILVVVVLIGALGAIVLSVTQGGLEAARARSAAKDLVAALRATRAQAVVEREAKVLVLDLERRAWQMPGRDWVELPGGFELSMLTAAEEQVGEQQGGIRFFPDGASTGGSIELRRGEALWRIEIAWLTGEVRMAPGSPR